MKYYHNLSGITLILLLKILSIIHQKFVIFKINAVDTTQILSCHQKSDTYNSQKKQQINRNIAGSI